MNADKPIAELLSSALLAFGATPQRLLFGGLFSVFSSGTSFRVHSLPRPFQHIRFHELFNGLRSLAQEATLWKLPFEHIAMTAHKQSQFINCFVC